MKPTDWLEGGGLVAASGPATGAHWAATSPSGRVLLLALSGDGCRALAVVPPVSTESAGSAALLGAIRDADREFRAAGVEAEELIILLTVGAAELPRALGEAGAALVQCARRHAGTLRLGVLALVGDAVRVQPWPGCAPAFWRNPAVDAVVARIEDYLVACEAPTVALDEVRQVFKHKASSYLDWWWIDSDRWVGRVAGEPVVRASDDGPEEHRMPDRPRSAANWTRWRSVASPADVRDGIPFFRPLWGTLDRLVLGPTRRKGRLVSSAVGGDLHPLLERTGVLKAWIERGGLHLPHPTDGDGEVLNSLFTGSAAAPLFELKVPVGTDESAGCRPLRLFADEDAQPWCVEWVFAESTTPDLMADAILKQAAGALAAAEFVRGATAAWDALRQLRGNELRVEEAEAALFIDASDDPAVFEVQVELQRLLRRVVGLSTVLRQFESLGPGGVDDGIPALQAPITAPPRPLAPGLPPTNAELMAEADEWSRSWLSTTRRRRPIAPVDDAVWRRLDSLFQQLGATTYGVGRPGVPKPSITWKGNPFAAIPPRVLLHACAFLLTFEFIEPRVRGRFASMGITAAIAADDPEADPLALLRAVERWVSGVEEELTEDDQRHRGGFSGEGQERHRLGADAIAHYLGYHGSVDEWGVKIDHPRVGAIVARDLARTKYRPPGRADLALSKAFGAMLLKILHHELHHHAEELFITVEELSEARGMYPGQKFGKDNGNEALANADAIDRSLWFLGASAGNHPVAERLAGYLPDVPTGPRVALAKWAAGFLEEFCGMQPGQYANFDLYRRERAGSSPPKATQRAPRVPARQTLRVGAADASDYWTGVPWWFENWVGGAFPATTAAPTRPGVRTHAVSMDQARGCYGELDELAMVYLPEDPGAAFQLSRLLRLFGYLNYLALGNKRWR